MKIAILGWGSLIWEKDEDFNSQLQFSNWDPLGPDLKLEFSRVSSSRHGALTLVIDLNNGTECGTFFNLSTSSRLGDVRHSLMRREKCGFNKIGFVDNMQGNSYGRSAEVIDQIRGWSKLRKLDAVVWTDLPSNFPEECCGLQKGTAFTVDSGLVHLSSLSSIGKEKAKEYFLNAPEGIETPLRQAVATALKL